MKNLHVDKENLHIDMKNLHAHQIELSYDLRKLNKHGLEFPITYEEKSQIFNT